MAAEKEDKERVSIKQFSDKSSNFWVDYSHYFLNQDNELIWCAGEADSEIKRTVLTNYIKRNKKVYQDRIRVEQIEYFQTFKFGKHINQKVDYVKDVDRKYLVWCRDNYQFKSGEEKLKEEIINVLK